MATTATIDNIFLATAKTSENGSKSNAGNSGDFEKIFKTANETYNTSTPSHSPTANTVKNDSKKQDDSENKVDSDKPASNDNKVEDNQTKPKDHKETSSNNNDTKADTKTENSEQDKTVKSEPTNDETKESVEIVKTKIEENTAENQPAQPVDSKQIKPDNQNEIKVGIAPVIEKTTDTEQVTDTKEIKTNIPKNKPKEEEKEETKTTDAKESTDNNQVQTPVVDNSIQTSVQAAIIGSNIETSPENNKQNADDKTTAITNSTEIAANKQQAQYVQNDIDIDVSQVTSKITSSSKSITTDQSNDQTNNIKIQPQTQQVISNLKASQDDAVQIQPEEQTTRPNTNTPQQTGIQTEIIKTNAEVIVSDANIKPKEPNTKQDLKEVTNQNTLTQDMLDKTNAKIVSTESSNSETANHFSSKQNAQEHVIKLSLENNNENTNNAELNNVSDKTIQPGFDKTLSGVQTIIQTASAQTAQTTTATTAQTTLQHMPKELSQTDILSQINNQLNVKNIQEGTSKVNIVLQPENLGKINLELVNSKEGLTAHMTTDNEQVKEILTKSLDSLKNSLGNQGVNVQSVTVKVDATQKQSNDNMSSFDNSQSNTSNQDFSNNSQKQNQNEFIFDKKTDSLSYKAEARTTKESDALADTEVENLVSIGSRSGRVDYKV